MLTETLGIGQSDRLRHFKKLQEVFCLLNYHVQNQTLLESAN